MNSPTKSGSSGLIRFGNSIGYARARINAQMNPFDKRSRAAEVISNNGTRYAVHRRIQTLMKKKFPYMIRRPSIEEEEAQRRAARKAAIEAAKATDIFS